MKKSLIICSVLLLIVSLFAAKGIMNSKIEETNYKKDPVILVNEIRNRIIKKYTNKYRLRISALEDSMFQGIVSEVGVGFNIYKVVTKSYARKILIECVQDFVKAINLDEELRPFLGEYPFTNKNISVSLFIYKPNGEFTYHPDLCIASAYGGYLIFNTDDHKTKSKFKTEEKESFEEALEKVKTETTPEEVL